MTPESGASDKELSELNAECDRLRRLREEKVALRNEYAKRVKSNEVTLRRLRAMKEQNDYLKEVVRLELFRESTSSGKQSILMSNLVNEFRNKSERIELEYKRLPSVLLVKDVREHNERLTREIEESKTSLESAKMEHSRLLILWKRNLREKIIEFSGEFSKWNAKGNNT